MRTELDYWFGNQGDSWFSNILKWLFWDSFLKLRSDSFKQQTSALKWSNLNRKGRIPGNLRCSKVLSEREFGERFKNPRSFHPSANEISYLLPRMHLWGCVRWRWRLQMWVTPEKDENIWERGEASVIDHKVSQKMNLGQKNITLGWFLGTLVLVMNLSRWDDSSQTCASRWNNVHFNYMTTNLLPA